ncbi:hypothetical protein LOK49_LG05G01934 [Camellia lanceoleosa]|uniref:Uncharacterized protein n=1 Tax=Camellia lanceoleosa TaxID=1840588 RepID=A0ACC0HQK7_9ERIC|nr:hypothetical protein LOK49_LG05G01934 [Camellia lanceoleosa]
MPDIGSKLAEVESLYEMPKERMILTSVCLPSSGGGVGGGVTEDEVGEVVRGLRVGRNGLFAGDFAEAGKSEGVNAGRLPAEVNSHTGNKDVSDGWRRVDEEILPDLFAVTGFWQLNDVLVALF